MGFVEKTVRAFKLEATEEMLTANAGLAWFGEFARGVGLNRWLEQEMLEPGSGRGLGRRVCDAASQIVPGKDAAAFTYQGEQGYMPMIGHLPEAGIVIHDEFRAGDIAPATQNLEFIKACEARLPKGHRIARGEQGMWKSNASQFAVLCALTGLLVSDAFAQVYPVRPIRVIDAFAPGGGTDIVARIIAPRFQASMGQPLVVDNRPGAAGIIGAEIAAKSAPDGYTLLMFVTNFTIHPSLYKNLPYDFPSAFTPVTQTSSLAMVLVAHPSVPAKTIKELLALAKARPGRLNISSSGVGGITHMAGELFKSMAGVNMTPIAYKGGAPATVAVVSGEVDLTFASVPVALPHIRDGRLRPLAVSSRERSMLMPDVPTIGEAGAPGYEVTNEYGVLAPAGTPRAIIAKLQQEIAHILKLPDVRKRFLELGMEPVGSTPEQFAERLRSQVEKWTKVVKDTGMELQTL